VSSPTEPSDEHLILRTSHHTAQPLSHVGQDHGPPLQLLLLLMLVDAGMTHIPETH
jgi:hypothetical protein